MEKAITIIDVAKESGVSVGTVSNVLNDADWVGEEYREKVHRAVEKMRYRRNLLAGSLKTKRTKIIGLIVPDIRMGFWPEVARGIEDVASDLGYNVMLCNSDEHVEKEASYIEVLRSKMVDGILYSGSQEDTAENEPLKVLLGGNIPVVMLERYFEYLPFPEVIVDNLQGGYEATIHLLKLGHRKIGFISGPISLINVQNRFAGYKKALEEFQVPFDNSLVEEGMFTFESGYTAMKKLLSKDNKLTAVFAANDPMAIGALHAIKDSGLDVPKDIAIVGFDNVDMASYVDPPLTTVAQPMYELGSTAMKILLRLINKEKVEKKVVLKTKLIVRKSCSN